MPRPLPAGAVGIPPAPPTAAMLAHPERVARWANVTRLIWFVRLAAIGGLLLLLYSMHLL